MHRRTHSTGRVGIIATNEIFPSIIVRQSVKSLGCLKYVVGCAVGNELPTKARLRCQPEALEDLTQNLLRREEIDVVAADIFQIEQDTRELGCGDFCAFAVLASLEVLTKHVAQIAPAENDRARPVPAT